MRARAVKGLLCLLCLLCFAMGRSLAEGLAGLEGLYILDMDRALTGQEAAGLLTQEQAEEQPAAFTLWGQRAGQIAENPELSRFAQVDAVLLAGRPAGMVSASAPLEAGDVEGCLIDKNTAMTLFGSRSPAGSTLRWGGRTLTVRGIVAGEDPLLLVQALHKDGGLDHLSLRTPEGANARRFLEELLARHGLSGRWERPGTWADIARACSLLPAWVLLLPVIFSLIRSAFAVGEYPARFLLFLLTAGAVWFFLLWAVGFSLDIPEETLPAKWSDFDFWGRLFQEKRAELLAMFAREKTWLHLAYLLPALRACGFGAGAAVLVPLSLGRVRPETGRELWIWCALIECFCFWMALGVDPVLARERAVWLCPVAALGMGAAAMKLEEWMG